MTINHKALAVAAVLVLGLAIVTPSFAQESTPPKTPAETARKTAQERVKEIQDKAKERRAAIKADVCERRQAQIQKKTERLTNNVTNLKSVIDKIYTRVQGFYESGQLTVANYSELKAAVDAAKAEAEAAIAALDTFQITVDCDEPSVGQQLDSFRSAIKDARDALKSYRAALVDLISAMRAAAAQDN